MINLLPSETIIANQWRYRRHRFLVAGVLLLSVLLIALGVLGYFTWVIKLRAAAVGQQLTELKKRSEAKELIELERNWRLTEQQLKKLAPLGVPAPSPAVLWGQVIAAKPVGIRLTKILFVASPGATTTLALGGTASSRKSLLALVEQLRRDKTFRTVDSPVDNLIKDRDTPFVINLEIYDQH
jgi:hypothetical protein